MYRERKQQLAGAKKLYAEAYGRTGVRKVRREQRECSQKKKYTVSKPRNKTVSNLWWDQKELQIQNECPVDHPSNLPFSLYR